MVHAGAVVAAGVSQVRGAGGYVLEGVVMVGMGQRIVGEVVGMLSMRLVSYFLLMKGHLKLH
jgi:hypothetical protein